MTGAAARVLVTGAASGVGAAIVDGLLDLGATVLAVDVVPVPATGRVGLASQICDVRDRDLVTRVVDEFAEQGGLTGLVTSAAVYGRDVRLDDLRPDDVEHVLGVNVLGTLWVAQAAMPHLRRTSGSAVCVGSVAGRMGSVLAGAHYAASKGAIHALVHTLAKTEIGHGVRINGVAPGPVATPMIEGRGYDTAMFPIGRYADPGEVADAVLYLLSPRASYVTGTILDVNGGLYVR
ncbi:SDR family oxidoreductase [Nocardioides sp. LHD-245]|uniref:SDR family NAD(P)-dependent oxidoreductase n=1 Tax=Nocardioides sp. LHD-245 TaxID=3051387 RepID=UPI0027E21101|nr:SDR family oxidoreductase [Nocardioides sp. LHD-245]